MAECHVCGKTLRTGRKYCYLHRGSGNESGQKHIISKAKKAYMDRIKAYFFLIIIICVLWILILALLFGNIIPETMTFLFWPPLIIIGVLILPVLLKLNIFKLIFEINERNRTKNYEKFVKDFSKRYKEKKEYEKKLVD